MNANDTSGHAPAPKDVTSAAHEKELAKASRQSRSGDVPNKAVQEQEQMGQAAQHMANKGQLAINEGGRTNDSSVTENPEGAVHGLPKPALKGTWR